MLAPNGSVRRQPNACLCALTGALTLAVALVFGGTQSAAAENASDAVTIVIDGQRVVVDGTLVEQLAAALDEHGDDAAALQQAIARIVQENASGADSQLLAKAILRLAVMRSGRDADTVAAIIAGVQAGNGTLDAGDLVAVLPPPADSSSDVTSTATQSSAATENPQQVSPVNL